MKTLILLRHGEASFDAGSDFERPLTANGISQVIASASVLKNLKITPDKIICSPAERTAETVSLFCDFLSIEEKIIKYIKGLYNQSYDFYLNEIISTNDSVNSLLIVGHNPSISDVANYFSSNEYINMRPSDLFIITFDTNRWNQIYTCSSQIVVQKPNI